MFSNILFSVCIGTTYLFYFLCYISLGIALIATLFTFTTLVRDRFGTYRPNPMIAWTVIPADTGIILGLALIIRASMTGSATWSLWLGLFLLFLASIPGKRIITLEHKNLFFRSLLALIFFISAIYFLAFQSHLTCQ